MAGTATATQGASAQTQQQAVESPEIVAARSKYADAGYARNRAEAAYNTAKKEQGADSEAAKAALKTLEAAQAEVEKAQAELRDALKLSKKAPAPAPAQAKKPAEAPAQPASAPTAVPPKGAYIFQSQKAFYFDTIYTKSTYEVFYSLPIKLDPKCVARAIQGANKDPKNLNHYLEQLNKCGRGQTRPQS
ncbi:MAG TPA: hypothetical protein VFW62_08335 [bacterium]|nr:hypothetical protein [bacterium]